MIVWVLVFFLIVLVNIEFVVLFVYRINIFFWLFFFINFVVICLVIGGFFVKIGLVFIFLRVFFVINLLLYVLKNGKYIKKLMISNSMINKIVNLVNFVFKIKLIGLGVVYGKL